MSEARATVGTDPEFFVRDNNGKLVSAIPLIEGTKESPEPLPGGGNVQRDNVALEFATDPASSTKEFVEKIGRAFQDIFKKLPKGHDLEVLPSAVFDSDQLDHPEAKEFGCSPDFDAWEMMQNDPPAPKNDNFRSCGGHIHTGHVEGDGNDFLLDIPGKVKLVKMQDAFHGIISAILDRSQEAIDRRQLYGKAGCHRPTSYGVEYRTLSNYWMKSPILVMLMDSLTQDCLKMIREDKDDDLIEAIGEDVIQTIINEGRATEAQNILNTHLIEHLSKDSKFYLDEALAKIDSFDFKKEWKLEVHT